MFKTLYAVCSDSRIDGGAPGYFAIAMCETREDAEEIKKDIDEYLRKARSTKESANEFEWGFGAYEYDIFDFARDKNFSLGYRESIDSKEVYIIEVSVVSSGEGQKFVPFLIENAERIQKMIQSD